MGTAFMATLREGIESVIFLTGVSGGQGIKSVILPGIIGLVLGLLTGFVIFWT
jgi:high-affinity iron transporter